MSIQHVTFQFASRGDAPAIASLSRDLIEDGLGWQYRADRIRELIDDVDEQRALDRAIELRASGSSLRSIARLLTREGYLPKRADR